MTTKLMKCTCKHAYQDELYGVGNRMANEMRSGSMYVPYVELYWVLLKALLRLRKP